MDRIIDRRAGQPRISSRLPPLGWNLPSERPPAGHLLEVHDDAISAGLGHQSVEGNDDDAGVASLLDGAVERVGEEALMTIAS